MRKIPLVNDNYYHIFNRSIAKYVIFNDSDDYYRIINLFDLYRFSDFTYKYSKFRKLSAAHQKSIIDGLKGSTQLVDMITFCIMPTHIHLILKQNVDKGITRYMARVLDGYTRYFNTIHKRKGPLWEGHFEGILVDTDEQLLHLSRYVHLNPTSAGLVKKPHEWPFSSYGEYISKSKDKNRYRLCQYENLIGLNPKEYRKFVQDRVSYQQELSKIKRILLDNYSG